MLPGRYPHEELASALMRVASERSAGLEDELRRDERGVVRVVNRYLPAGGSLLLVIDQFEELFTLADEWERTAFLNLLMTAATDHRCDIRIVLTMRADFFDRPLRFGEFGDLLRDSTVPVASPTADAMRAMIEQPASSEGITFEAGLVDRILSDVGDQPGALPLLEFSLTELFAQRQADQISAASYVDSGGVLGALGRRAESIFEGLEPSEQAAARQVLLRLVHVGESGRDTRRRTRRAELDRLGIDRHELDGVLAAFGNHRLLTFDRDPITRGPTVEVAHEALLSKWPTLVGWIDDQREDLLLHRRFLAALGEWEASDQSEAYLLTGGRLAQNIEWAASTDLTLTSREHEYLSISRQADDRRRASRRRRRQMITTGFGFAAVIASVLALLAFVAQRDADDQRRLARAGELGANSLVALDSDPELAVLLAAEAVDVEATPSAVSALHQGVQSHRALKIIPSPGEGSAMGAVDPGGTGVAVMAAGTSLLQMWDIDGTEPVWEVTLSNDQNAQFGEDSHFWFSTDGSTLLVPLSQSESTFDGPGVGLYTVDAATGVTLDFFRFRVHETGGAGRSPIRGAGRTVGCRVDHFRRGRGVLR